MPEARIIHGNALDLPLEDETVDLIVTSPPYFALRTYTDGGEHYDGQVGGEDSPTEYLDTLLAATREMARVLKPSGSIWVNLGDKYASSGGHGGIGSSSQRQGRSNIEQISRPERNTSGVPTKSLIGTPWRYAIRCIDELGLILRAEVIWSKPNGLPESVTDRVRRSHEVWFHLTRYPQYFSAVDEIREQYEARPQRRFSPRRTDEGRPPERRMPEDYVWETPTAGTNPLGKLPGSVWDIPTQPLVVPPELGVDHFAAFPIEWPLRIIKGWSPLSGTVLDPFGGTGTTALAAKVLGRVGISVDLSSDYCRLAEWRVNDPGQIARAVGMPKPIKEAEGQIAFF